MTAAAPTANKFMSSLNILAIEDFEDNSKTSFFQDSLGVVEVLLNRQAEKLGLRELSKVFLKHAIVVISNYDQA